ncbi:hypothetical protein KTH44_16240 [Acinetobacter bereziniae]|uniref:hypothetical protein n=1 Tax=Acinetobacter bereziniae TaxID=106648 RepID=UPI0021CD258D|nr:hypothetical protein [Acinetobacter bereziniae]MCU4320667.1 hypothetical protein [Acinetobacter bereziniae]
MTTINDLTVEQMREIVESAPDSNCFYDPINNDYYSFAEDGSCELWDLEQKKWVASEFEPWHGSFIEIEDIQDRIKKHPEFMVGDKVVSLICDDILTIISFGHGNFLKAKGFNCHGMTDGECNVLSYQIRHAKDEEIKAGHRIKMDRFEEFIVKKYPSRSAKVLLNKLQDNDGTWFYAVKEVQDQSEAWKARQVEIDNLNNKNKEAYSREIKKFEENLILKSNIEDKENRIDMALALIDTTSYSEISRRMADFIDQLKEALRGKSE